MFGKGTPNADESSAGENESAAEGDQSIEGGGSGSEDNHDGSSAAGEDDGSSSDTGDERWEESFNRLLEFKRREGHCLVPFRYKHDRKLGKWGEFRLTSVCSTTHSGSSQPCVL
jgi:hypothetical protein